MMAFSNLFTSLCEVDRDVKEPTHRNEDNAKRQQQTKQTGPCVKRQQRRRQPYTASLSNEEHESPEAHRFNWSNNDPRPGTSRGTSYRHNHGTFSRHDHYRGNANNTHMKKAKNKGMKHRQRETAYRNARTRNQRQRYEDRQPRKPFMTQEFKEQHSLEVDGRFICIHFLRGQCIKGEGCQFEHIESYNGLIKKACKFYIQGFCLKGTNCPYLHETFPCKFFHTKGRCRRESCMFSHDPLTDLTKKLLDDFIEREEELKKKAEEETQSQTENVTESVEEKTTVEIAIPTDRLSFYQSSTVKEDALVPDEEPPAEEDDTPQRPVSENNGESEDALPSALEPPEPVCYSVEALLGPKLFKPCLYNTQKSQEDSLSESKTTSDSPFNCVILLLQLQVISILRPQLQQKKHQMN
ncbi:hypothetical protein WMY93_007145 [Mugilogobius chulae]|uniref:C3H1-type domain-containing protein n=1 Tax=Mugilogobius chulae TaxID=88201 RepID=A0AAW0PLS7_9GOBI